MDGSLMLELSQAEWELNWQKSNVAEACIQQEEN